MKNYMVKELLSEMMEDRLEMIDRDTAILVGKIDMYTSIVESYLVSSLVESLV